MAKERTRLQNQIGIEIVPLCWIFFIYHYTVHPKKQKKNDLSLYRLDKFKKKKIKKKSGG